MKTWGPIKAELTCFESYCLFHMMTEHVQKVSEGKIQRHNRKLFQLWRKEHSHSPECIHNYSGKDLTLHEHNALYQGLKHHILPKKVNEYDVKCNIENTVDKLCNMTGVQTDLDFRDEVKILTTAFLKKSASECQKRSNQSFHRTLNSLKKDTSIKVCRLDKGNGVAILRTDDYYKKLNKIVLDRSKFKYVDFDVNCDVDLCKSAPWIRKEESIKYYIRTYLSAISSDSKSLMPTGSGPGRLYGMAKVHKIGCPLRPVNSMLGTAEYKLAKWLDNLIKPHIPDEYTVNSTKNFIQKFQDFDIRDGDFCVSFDVESLFTNVPLSEVIRDICNYFFEHHEDYFRPTSPLNKYQKELTKPILSKLLHLCTEGMFLYNGHLYQQIDGVAMGSPLGPTLANWFLGSIEKRIFNLSSVNCFPKFYVRYVDDVFAVFNCDTDRDQFFDLLNKQHSNLRFTVELADGTLPFLDVEIDVQGDNVSTWVYRKSTYTEVLLSFNAIAPLQWKRSLISCLLHRASVVCSSDYLFQCEVGKLKTMFLKNNYPLRFFNNVLSSFMRSHSQSLHELPDESEVSETEVYLRIPYMGSPSLQFGKRVQRLLHDKFDIPVKIAFYTFKVGDYFVLKDKVPLLFRSNLVYSFSCPCDRVTSYMGMTTRQLFVRIGEHFKRGNCSSAVYSHLAKCQTCHEVTSKQSNFRLVTTCRSERETEIKEAMYIRRFKPSLNVQMGTFQGASFLIRVFR